jgi:drug/metabolite transporter (DMT)-like permease
VSITIWSMLLVVASQVAYHLAQKAVPAGTPPFAVFALVYLAGAALCFGAAAVSGTPVTLSNLRGVLGWPAGLLALSVVGIEVGYLLAYRSGWSLGITFAVASTSTVALLALIGVALYGEVLSVRHVAGLALALSGGWLLAGHA